MKIRKGFVSNSSSSSFIVLGTSFDNENEEVARLLGKTVEEVEEGDSYDMEEELEDRAFKLGLEFSSGGDDYAYYVGVSPFDIKDNETGAEFKQRVEKAVKEFMKEETVKLVPIEEVWRNG
jgi:hypothetical protein